MAMCVLFKLLSVVQLLHLMLLTAVTAETRVEVSFTDNPVQAGGQTAFQCKIWEIGPNQLIGMSRTNAGVNIVLVRNGTRNVQQIPDHFFLDILPPQPDGSTPYHLTIVGVDTSDSGSYSCYVLSIGADGSVNAIAADSQMLEVTAEPETYLPPENYPVCSLTENRLSYYTGEEITLTCSSLDGKPSISLLWIRNDRMEIPENQTMGQDENILTQNVTQTLYEEDNGTIFKCVIKSIAFPSNGQECSIGPIAVWKSPGTSSNTTDGMTKIDGELNPRTIFGLSEAVFVMIVVAAGIIVIITLILLIVYCTRAYSCACLIRKRKSYRMDGRGNKEDGGTLRTDGTLSAGVELQYVPARPAPAPPPPPTYMESQRDSMSHQRYIQNASASSTTNKRLSTVETALLMAVSRSFTARDPGRPQFNSSQSIQEEKSPQAADTEIIYANTSRSSSVVDLYNMGRDEDNDSGVVNPAYDGSNGSPGFSGDDQPLVMSAASNSRPVSEIIYHNTSELAINARPPSPEIDDIPQYAKVNKSRTSTMESVKKEKSNIQPESVATLDTDSLYHNTSDLGINTSDSYYPTPPPIPTNPPSPTSETPTKKSVRPKLYSASSLGGPEKPSFKPPPPPANAQMSVEQDTTIGEGDSGLEKPAKPAKPLPPKKPTHKI